MSVQVTDKSGIHDRFKTKCPYCGRELTYDRRNVRPHRRWPNGFIFCPGCKRPIGHNEANLFQSGDEVLKEKEAQRKPRDVSNRECPRAFVVLRSVMFGVGIPTLITGAFLFTLALILGYNWSINVVFFLIFNVGLAMTIAGGIFNKLINER